MLILLISLSRFDSNLMNASMLGKGMISSQSESKFDMLLEFLSGFDTATLFSKQDMLKFLADVLAFVGHFKTSYIVMKQFGNMAVFSQMDILIIVHVKYLTFNWASLQDRIKKCWMAKRSLSRSRCNSRNI